MHGTSIHAMNIATSEARVFRVEIEVGSRRREWRFGDIAPPKKIEIERRNNMCIKCILGQLKTSFSVFVVSYIVGLYTVMVPEASAGSMPIYTVMVTEAIKKWGFDSPIFPVASQLDVS